MKRVKRWITKCFPLGKREGRNPYVRHERSPTASPSSEPGTGKKKETDSTRFSDEINEEGINIQLDLHDHIIRNDVVGCKEILDGGFDPNQPFCTEYKVSGSVSGLSVKRVETTYVHLAIIYRRPAVLRVLLQAGASPQRVDSAGRCPLQVAVTYWPRARYTDPYTLITDDKADIGKYRQFLKNQHTNSELMFQMLMDYGAELDVTCGENRESLLHLAARYNAIGCATQLLSHGAPVSTTNSRGESPLHTALCGAHLQLASLLVEMGTNVNIKDQDGVTALHHASQVDNSVDGSTIKLLLSCGAEIGERDKEGNTALHHAAMVGNAAAILLLLMNDADADLVNNYGCSPLSFLPPNPRSYQRLEKAVHSLYQWSLYTKPTHHSTAQYTYQENQQNDYKFGEDSREAPPSLTDISTHKIRRCLGYKGTQNVMTFLPGLPIGLSQLIMLD